MLVLAILCSMLLSQVNANWKSSRSGPIRADMKFYVMNMTCNDARTRCEACKSGHEGGIYLDLFEYSEGPAKFHFEGTTATSNWKDSILQEDPLEPFRYCTQNKNTYWGRSGIVTHRFYLCVDNIFSDITVPTECFRPIALISTSSQHGDDRQIGDQTLYCAN
ncbi:uncharacterized protein LOC110984242 [Acanthaster planci]|uniref:Uncharacterized protein LOC110984242 n=1 Tax=Acanthaster planci TaxID=133434 RepID=A0A8B7Z9J4_ACAPL|nr:uncharacterized protein LOC110984242 [Acanthaster planci]